VADLPASLLRAVPSVERAALEGDGHIALRQRMAAAIKRNVAFDAACLATLDPVTVMWTHCQLEGMDRDHALEARLFDAEFRRDDVGKLAEVAQRPLPVSLLCAETGGDPAKSARFREAYAPAGIGDEARLLLVDGGVAWGSIHLLRATGRRFAESEARALAQVGPAFARALRHALLRAAAEHADLVDRDPPGLVVMDASGRVLESSAEAERLVGGPVAKHLPPAAGAVAARALSGCPAAATAPLPEGGWLVFHGTSLGDRVGVLVERARSLELASVVVNALKLTPRERQVVEEVARGRSTKEISVRLRIGEWTVQDHLKSIFDKAGVSTRSELVAALFFGHWAPEHERGSTPSVYGHYLRRR
jgi:DNA-binding CsgD family transcriptional regulator